MENQEIVESFKKEMDTLQKNIVINNCDICKKLYRQKSTFNVCNKCNEMSNVF